MCPVAALLKGRKKAVRQVPLFSGFQKHKSNLAGLIARPNALLDVLSCSQRLLALRFCGVHSFVKGRAFLFGEEVFLAKRIELFHFIRFAEIGKRAE